MREARRSDGQRKLEEDEAERAERSKAGRDSGGGPDRICPLSLDRFVGGCQWQHECTSAESEARSQRRARGVREDLTPTRLDESGTGAWCHFAGETCVQRLHAPVYRTCVLAGAHSVESARRGARGARRGRKRGPHTHESGTGAWCHFTGEMCVQQLHAPV